MADATLKIGDETFEIQDFTLGEVEDLEEAFGCPLSEIDFKSAKGLVWLVYIVKHRKDPDFTYEDARNTSSSDISGAENGNGSRPTQARKKRATAGKPRTAS